MKSAEQWSLECPGNTFSPHFTEWIKSIQLDAVNDALDAAKRENEKMRQALGLMVRWGKSEEAGPDYFGMTRDTHPQGEEIWGAWWNGNLDLCARAQVAMKEALHPEVTIEQTMHDLLVKPHL